MLRFILVCVLVYYSVQALVFLGSLVWMAHFAGFL